MNLIVLQKLNNVASASLDKTVSVWDSHTQERILTLHGHKKGVFDLTYNPQHRLIFSCGFEHDACVWSPFVNSLVYRLKGHHASLVGCQSVEGSHEVITADTSGVFKLWDVRNFMCVQTFSANLSGQETKDSSKLTCFMHSNLSSRNSLQEEDDSRIYAASKMLFSFDQARVVHEATSDYFNVCWMAWIPESSVIITASEHNVIVWDGLIGSKTFT
jgi:WD40 repeat protein